MFQIGKSLFEFKYSFQSCDCEYMLWVYIATRCYIRKARSQPHSSCNVHIAATVGRIGSNSSTKEMNNVCNNWESTDIRFIQNTASVYRVSDIFVPKYLSEPLDISKVMR